MDVETGKGSDALDRRPQLAAALAKARKAKAPQRDGTRSQVTPAEPSHRAPAPVHRPARRGGEKQQIDDDPVPF